MKKLLVFLMISCMVFIVGCNKVNSSESKNEVGKQIETQNGLQIKVAKVTNGHSYSNSEKETVLQVSFEIKNINKKDNGAGAYDFKIKTDKGKIYNAYSLESKNFGSEIKSGSVLKGEAYYEIPSNTNQVTLYYEPDGKILASWKLDVPSK